MSAIWGAIHLKGGAVKDVHKSILRSAFDKCIIDRYEEMESGNVYMGCGIQYFTKEAKYEVLPIRENNLFFDADVIVDNRKDLLKLCKFGEEIVDLSDGYILFKMYQTYGKKCLNKLLGAYAFVFYDKQKESIDMVIDAVGYRLVYYMIHEEVLYYSSLMEPLEQIMQQVKINYRWISDFLGQDNLNMFTEGEETSIEGIYRVPPGSIYTFSKDGIHKERYWDPYRDQKKIRLKDDGAYKTSFLDLYKECVSCLLRSEEETSIFLSGGFDSTSVAVLAAKELAKQNKKLYAYTSIPLEGYESEFKKNIIVDEKELVLKTKEYIPNLECEFMSLPEMNAWYDRKDYVKVVEMPYKSVQNLLWMFEGMKKSYNKNARIMLVGNFGNSTVSFDNKEVFFTWLFQRGLWLRLYREINAMKKRHGYTRKSILLSTIKNAFGLKGSKEEQNLFENSYVNNSLVEYWGTKKRMEIINKKESKYYSNYKVYQEAQLPLETLRHCGEIAMKNSLYSGVIYRDPTRDKRMIEFTVGIPYSQFTHNGYCRRLITEYMKGIMPEHIIKERRQGRQSADLRARMITKQKVIKEEWKRIYEVHRNSKVVNCNKALQHLEKKNIEDMKDFEIVRHIFTIMTLEYIDEKEQE